MSVKLYMDVHIRRAVTFGLRLRGIDVLTAQEDGSAELTDPELLDRANKLERIIFSQDDDLFYGRQTEETKLARPSRVLSMPIN